MSVPARLLALRRSVGSHPLLLLSGVVSLFPRPRLLSARLQLAFPPSPPAPWHRAPPPPGRPAASGAWLIPGGRTLSCEATSRAREAVQAARGAAAAGGPRARARCQAAVSVATPPGDGGPGREGGREAKEIDQKEGKRGTGKLGATGAKPRSGSAWQHQRESCACCSAGKSGQGGLACPLVRSAPGPPRAPTLKCSSWGRRHHDARDCEGSSFHPPLEVGRDSGGAAALREQ
ncbi:putative cuticle collagen 91 [Microtus ochrogaster]|uniref:Cuticle collagen 91 n=1 Tax=Microtus ochrogaster TaxID=79684 RepID=A0ABM1UCI4_MICOH|nr:putative cuticle collagen 91 [Microtus ochrogaster]